MAQALHFRGKENVLLAYRNNGVGPWAIISGKCIISSSDGVANDDVDSGADQLDQFLAAMLKGGTEARYTLNVYKLKGEQDIDAGTKEFRSFNFSLWEAGQVSVYQGVRNADQEMKERMDRLESLVLELADKDEGPEEPEEKSGIGAVLSGIMEMPGVKEQIAMGAAHLVKNIFRMGDQFKEPARVAGAEPGPSVLNQDQINKVNQALEILAARDPLLGDHLLSLAQKSPEVYAMALKFL